MAMVRARLNAASLAMFETCRLALMTSQYTGIVVAPWRRPLVYRVVTRQRQNKSVWLRRRNTMANIVTAVNSSYVILAAVWLCVIINTIINGVGNDDINAMATTLRHTTQSSDEEDTH